MNVDHKDLLGYEKILISGDPNFEARWIEDEWEVISLKYTLESMSITKGGTSICCISVNVKDIFGAIDEHKVTHLCAVPTVLSSIANAPPHK